MGPVDQILPQENVELGDATIKVGGKAVGVGGGKLPIPTGVRVPGHMGRMDPGHVGYQAHLEIQFR